MWTILPVCIKSVHKCFQKSLAIKETLIFINPSLNMKNILILEVSIGKERFFES